jgi:hypothetical protein
MNCVQRLSHRSERSRHRARRRNFHYWLCVSMSSVELELERKGGYCLLSLNRWRNWIRTERLSVFQAATFAQVNSKVEGDQIDQISCQAHTKLSRYARSELYTFIAV